MKKKIYTSVSLPSTKYCASWIEFIPPFIDMYVLCHFCRVIDNKSLRLITDASVSSPVSREKDTLDPNIRGTQILFENNMMDEV